MSHLPTNKTDLMQRTPHPSKPESPSSLLMSTQNDLRDNLKGCHIQHPSGAYDTSDRPTQGDTPYALQ